MHDESQHIGSLENAKQQFLQGLYECQREYNINDAGIDIGGEDRTACSAGGFNKIIEKLAKIHPDAEIIFMTKATAAAKFACVLREETINYLSRLAKQDTIAGLDNFFAFLKKVQEDGVEPIWSKIKDIVANRMFEEFGSLYKDKNDPAFTGMIESGLYVIFKELPSFQREISESKGYKKYCSQLIRTSGFFHGGNQLNSTEPVATPSILMPSLGNQKN